MNDLFTVQRDERAHNLVSEGNALDAACCINTDLQQTTRQRIRRLP